MPNDPYDQSDNAYGSGCNDRTEAGNPLEQAKQATGVDMTVGEMKTLMKDYVTQDDYAHPKGRHQFQGDDYIRLDCKHNLLEQRWHDIRFCRTDSILEVKHKLHKHGAGAVTGMEIYLRRGDGNTIFLYDENKSLADYGADNDMEIFIKDNDEFSLARNGGLEDVSQVEKYRMSDEEYDKRENTLRNHVREERKKDPNFKLFAKKNAMDAVEGPEGEAEKKAAELAARPQTPKNVKELFPVGKRCEVNPGGRRGEIKFVGRLEGPAAEKQGTMIGVELDEPTGHNDGSIEVPFVDKETGRKSKKTVKFFDCGKGVKYGLFAKWGNVTAEEREGQFAELDPFAELEDEDEI